ncbi:MAG TPA: choice-of-anchor D domain-containing protein [Myxococcota bacterium]
MLSLRVLAVSSCAALAAACGTPITAQPDLVIVVGGGDCEGESTCAFDFGQVAVLHTKTNAFTLKNNGGATAEIAEVKISGDAAFTVANQAGTSVDIGKTASVTVSYTPTAQSTSNATLEVTWGADQNGDDRTTVALTGRGL